MEFKPAPSAMSIAVNATQATLTCKSTVKTPTAIFENAQQQLEENLRLYKQACSENKSSTASRNERTLCVPACASSNKCEKSTPQASFSVINLKDSEPPAKSPRRRVTTSQNFDLGRFGGPKWQAPNRTVVAVARSSSSNGRPVVYQHCPKPQESTLKVCPPNVSTGGLNTSIPSSSAASTVQPSSATITTDWPRPNTLQQSNHSNKNISSAQTQSPYLKAPNSPITKVSVTVKQLSTSSSHRPISANSYFTPTRTVENKSKNLRTPESDPADPSPKIGDSGQTIAPCAIDARTPPPVLPAV